MNYISLNPRILLALFLLAVVLTPCLSHSANDPRTNAAETAATQGTANIKTTRNITEISLGNIYGQATSAGAKSIVESWISDNRALLIVMQRRTGNILPLETPTHEHKVRVWGEP